MTAKEKAQELVEKFKEYVHGYIGSSMLTNHEYPEQILSQAKKVSIIVVDEIIKSNPTIPVNSNYYEIFSDRVDDAILYWIEVKSEIEKL